MHRYTKYSYKQNKKMKRKTRKHRKRVNKYIGGVKKTKTMKPMNCNPKQKNKTVKDDSCMTDEILHKLKNSYNKEHPTTSISSTEPTAIWADLKDRMTTCSKEDCWLDVIKDPNEREKIDKELFAPDMPREWKSKPNTWLSNFDIMAVLEQYQESHPNFKVLGPTPIDFDTRPPDKNGKCVWEELCTFSLKHYLDKKKTKIGIVFNLDKHNQGGSHWISLFLDLDDKYLFFLDSAGEKMPKEVKALVDRIVEQGKTLNEPIDIKVYENHPTEHQMGNTECGVYSLFFIISMLTNEVEGKPFSSLDEKIKFFKEKKIPDKYVEKYRKIYFNN